MKELSNLLGFRKSIKVVDATLRDGGLVNDFYFTDDFVKALYQANIDAGVDYMEMGYRASKKVFDESKFGKWKFCSDDHIREIVGENDTDLKLAIMADIGRHDKNDFDVNGFGRVVSHLPPLHRALHHGELRHGLRVLPSNDRAVRRREREHLQLFLWRGARNGHGRAQQRTGPASPAAEAHHHRRPRRGAVERRGTRTDAGAQYE